MSNFYSQTLINFINRSCIHKRSFVGLIKAEKHANQYDLEVYPCVFCRSYHIGHPSSHILSKNINLIEKYYIKSNNDCELNLLLDDCKVKGQLALQRHKEKAMKKNIKRKLRKNCSIDSEPNIII